MNLDELLKAAHTAAQLALTQHADAAGVRPIVIVMAPDGSYQWTGKGKTSAQLLELFGRMVAGLAANQQPAIYTCSVCSEPGQQHGVAPFPGWLWTPSGALLCPACRADLGELAPAPVLHLVPKGPDEGQPVLGARGPAGTTSGLEALDDPELLGDSDLGQAPLGEAPVWVQKGPEPFLGVEVRQGDPDLGQAPSNLGEGPVPLFLPGEDEDPEDEVVLDGLATSGMDRGARSDEEMRVETEARRLNEQERAGG